MSTMSRSKPERVLLTDTTHNPKTHGSVGILVVGIGGSNGTTTLCGILANRRNLTWRGPTGQSMSANYNGCITQLDQKGVHGGVGFRNKVKGLADANFASIGGWDIRPTKLGDALLEQQILDYDLVRQMKDEMNKTKFFKGYYDPRFIGDSQHNTATYTLELNSNNSGANYSAREALRVIRSDIRYFKWKNGVVGHTTMIWSASVEPNSEFSVEGGGLDTARELLEKIEMSEEERGGPLAPSLIYATAAILEGCSFVNGGSQNTLCGGLAELARVQNNSMGVYCLGTDFKAGQTKFKTAAVEYIRTMGLTPKVIASSNHLGNNDMRNLASADKARMAKLRVKHDIFAAWEEDIDHKVSVMFCPIINDEKRDFVEYTSSGFLGQTHTMVTYTRASDSVLCVPLMIDAAVWCDFFSQKIWPYESVAKALAYLFKVPEGAAKGVDPGFFRQMEELNKQALSACETKKKSVKQKQRVRIKEEEEKTSEWAIPNEACIVCAGLACVDMQLNQATGGDGGESIETFQGEKTIGGGSVSMATKTLARLVHGAPLDEDYMQITPPAVHSVIPLCKVGQDDSGNKLVSLLEKSGSLCRNVDTKYIKEARKRDPTSRTALAVLPIYQDGRRGCFFDAASNATFSSQEMVDMIEDTCKNKPKNILGAFLFGYPHLLPMMQGEKLAQIFLKAKSSMDEGGIIAMDMNGIPEMGYNKDGSELRSVNQLKNDKVIGAALEHIDILHLNEEELINLTGCCIEDTEDSTVLDESSIGTACSLFLQCGVAVVLVTRGKKGCFISCNNSKRFEKSRKLPTDWIDCTVKLNAMELPSNTVLNTNGAGDSFTSGFLVATLLRHTGITMPVFYGDSFRGGNEISSFDNESDNESDGLSDLLSSHQDFASIRVPGGFTPYTLYIREHYVKLKAQSNDDKKTIFDRCNEMWENESEEVKSMYGRKCEEELDDYLEDNNKSSDEKEDIIDNTNSFVNEDNTLLPDIDKTSKLRKSSMKSRDDDDNNFNEELANKALNLESAAQFASLVASYHIDVATRDNLHLDMSMLLERAMTNPEGLEEI